MKPMGRRQSVTGGSAGFTLLELLIVMGLFLVVMAGVYTTYQSQQRSYVAQEQVAEMQQNLRAGMFYLSQAIRMAGYDPEFTNIPGMVDEMPGFSGAGATCDATNIAFTLDDNANRLIDANDTEMVAFRLNDKMELQKFSTGAITWQTVAENIETLNFTYLDAAGAATTNLGNVRSVQVAMAARASYRDPDLPGDGYRRRTLNSRIQCRNMGL